MRKFVHRSTVRSIRVLILMSVLMIMSAAFSVKAQETIKNRWLRAAYYTRGSSYYWTKEYAKAIADLRSDIERLDETLRRAAKLDQRRRRIGHTAALATSRDDASG